MNEAPLALAVVACPVGMGLMVMHSRKHSSRTAPPPPPAINAQLIKLRAEVDQLWEGGRDAGQNALASPSTDIGSR
ncbi:hypothetical protein [Arthrobacter sp. VKM Ac-2550]|uniref:hypothetical protein n=1 Tax=Crystallibacter permensis TaxID=1938888 RepID=UPI002226D37A|nr:hypothetical protein [Arthrobacter sp. VKM Ac-2550]MCW2134139.1 hypothetical protein [Arthrobacter sp. VKM Ac-2550]